MEFESSLSVLLCHHQKAAGTSPMAATALHAPQMAGVTSAVPPNDCKLLDSFFGIFVQLFLVFLFLGILLVKRGHEKPQRSVAVWALDVAKQSAGASLGHIANVFLSMKVHRFTDSSSACKLDECQWYALSYFLDSSVGLLLSIVFLNAFEHFVNAFFPASSQCQAVKSSGDYGNNINKPNFNFFMQQLLVWLVIVLIAKAACLAVLVSCFDLYVDVMTYVFISLKKHKEMELITVMIIVPAILNTIQFWIGDSVLMKKRTNSINTSKHSKSYHPLSQSDLLLEETALSRDIELSSNISSKHNAPFYRLSSINKSVSSSSSVVSAPSTPSNNNYVRGTSSNTLIKKMDSSQ